MNSSFLLFLVLVCGCFWVACADVCNTEESFSVECHEDDLSRKKGSGGGGGFRPIRPPTYIPRRRRRRNHVIKEPVVFCYWGTWANLRPGIGKFGVNNIPIDLCTHVAYSFIGLNAAGGLTFPEKYVVQGTTNTVEDFLKLKQANANLKLLVAIGGWNEGSVNFSTVTNSYSLRATFVRNIVRYIEDTGFDGLDVDWEYPAQRGGQPSDKESFIWLLSDLKKAFTPKNWTLTVSVAATQYHIDTSYNVTSISSNVDYINLMTYDYYGSWSEGTGPNAPLYAEDLTSSLNVNQSVYIWMKDGADPNKMLLGLAAYGRSFNLTNLSRNNTDALFNGPGEAGPHTMEPGLLAYYEICKDQLDNRQDWDVKEVNYSYVYGNRGHLWVGYDNNNTMFYKGLYARHQDMAGVMLWTVDFDDFLGVCGTNYTLLRSSIEGYRSVGTVIICNKFLTVLLAIKLLLIGRL